MNPYEVRRIDELDAIPVPDADIVWRPIRRTLGIRAFGINAYTADQPGIHVVEEHTESYLGHEEVYVVVRGRARFTLGDDEVEAEPGTIVYLRDPATKRAAVALEPETTVLAIGGRPREPFEPSPWEWAFAATPLREAGDYEAALAVVREGLDHGPESAPLHYNVASHAALAGRRDEALEHLERAAALDRERVRRWSLGDRDLDSIRDDPRFLAITG